MNLPQDILDKILEDFLNIDDRNLIMNILENLKVNESHRIIRCILYVANGDLKTFGEYVEMAEIDYREVIMNAEYEYPSEKRLRDFSKSFTK